MRRRATQPLALAPLAVALGCAAAALTGAPPVAAGGPAEQDLGIVVLFAEDHGEEDLRRTFGATLLAELETEACFRSVRLLDPEELAELEAPPALLLRVTISEIEEKTHWDVGTAQLSNPNRLPDTDQQLAVETEAAFLAELVTSADGLRLRDKFYRDRKVYRPRMREDPRVASWDELVASAARTARRLVCGGSIEKDLRRARR